MTDADIGIRNRTYARFVELGRAPLPEEVGPRDEVLGAWQRLHDAHALVLDEARTAIRMANPFSAVPTAYRVQAGGRRWYGNCAWDAFGILAALDVDGRIESSCIDCGEPIASRCAASCPTTRRSSSTASSPPRPGGTTSSSPEAP